LAKDETLTIHATASLGTGFNTRAIRGFGHTNTLIAYELGLSPTTASGLLRSKMRRLRANRLAELAHRFA